MNTRGGGGGTSGGEPKTIKRNCESPDVQKRRKQPKERGKKDPFSFKPVCLKERRMTLRRNVESKTREVTVSV